MAYDLTSAVTTGQAKKLSQRLKSKIENVDVSGNIAHETFIFELDDGTSVTKEICLWNSQA